MIHRSTNLCKTVLPLPHPTQPLSTNVLLFLPTVVGISQHHHRTHSPPARDQEMLRSATPFSTTTASPLSRLQRREGRGCGGRPRCPLRPRSALCGRAPGRARWGAPRRRTCSLAAEAPPETEDFSEA